jgi:FG-GAP repeat protein
MRLAIVVFAIAACGDNEPLRFAPPTETYVKPSATGVFDEFGVSLAMSVDGKLLAAGAYGEDGGTADPDDNSIDGSGAVFVFAKAADGWAQQAYLKAAKPAAGDGFGITVALSIDTNTLAAGAFRDDTGATDSGAVYVFSRAGDTWEQQAVLKASNPGAGDHFGASLAMSGDGNTIAVGAADGSAAYVFARTGSSWTQQAMLLGGTHDDQFGYSVALSRDGNVLAIGARLEGGSGAARVFVRSGDSWSVETSVHGGSDGDQLGWSVALSPTGSMLVVGAVGVGGLTGAAFVFERRDGVLQPMAELAASNPDAGDAFGWSLAITPDEQLLAIGAPRESSAATGIGGDGSDNSAGSSGAAYMFVRSGETWIQAAYVKASNTGDSDRFGQTIALSARHTLAVGANTEASGTGDPADNSAPGAGALYVLE